MFIYLNITVLSLSRKQGIVCLFVGYDAHMKGWKCMDLVTKKIVTSCNVVFDEVSTSYLDFVNKENSKFVTLIDSSLEFFPIEFDSI